MIKINKKKNDAPATLVAKGVSELKKLKKLSKVKLMEYKFSSAIYGAKPVKEKLKSIQHDKCCFCESKISAVSHGDVEHFRPKAGWIQNEKDKLTKPGYYWLAYDFSNLYLSCQICNQVYKKNFFPLKNPANRAISHSDKVSSERPMIIDPGKTDPSKHLGFRAEVLIAKTKEGEETIKRTGLNRDELIKQRFEYLSVLRKLAKLAKKNAKKELKPYASDSSLYSLMVRDNFF